MDPFEYSTGLFAIVIGLAIADMAMSLHKLLACEGVRWGYRPVAATVLVAIAVSGMWFELWTVRKFEVVLTYPFYASLIVELFLIFLTAAAVLPDDAAPGMDLNEGYEANGRRLWICFTLYQILYFVHWLYFALNSSRFSISMLIEGLATALFVIVAPATLAIWPRAAWLHRILITVLIAFFLFAYSGAALR